MSKTIHKIGAIILSDRKLLIGRKKDTFIIPGGKIESNESHRECLQRELKEEFDLKLLSVEHFGEYEDAAALDPGMKIHMDVYWATAVGKPKQGAEIQEMKWIESKDVSSLKLGSVLTKFVIPKLVEKRVMD